MTVTAILGGAPEECKQELYCAIAISKLLGGKLKGILPMPDPANAAVYFVGGEVMMAGPASMEALREAQEESRKAIESVFETTTREAGTWLNSEFAFKTGPVNDINTACTLMADATVFPKGAAKSAHSLNPAFEHLLMEARMPVVLAPEEGNIHGPALIAWDGMPRSMRAIKAHLPIISALGHAVIAYNPKKTEASSTIAEEASPDALAAWLNEARVEAKVETFNGKVSEGLLQLAQKHNAGLIVMGVYGHSRIGQMLFGGTSKAMLNSDAAPALALAH